MNVLLATLIACHAADADEPRAMLEIYSLGFADAALVVDQVKGMLSSDGKVVYDQSHHRLLVFDYPEHHKPIKELIEKLQIPPKNIRIEVSILDKSTRKAVGLGATASRAVVVPEVDKSAGKVTSHTRNRSTTPTAHRPSL